MLERKQKQIERDVSRKAEFNLLLSLRNYVFLKQSRLAAAQCVGKYEAGFDFRRTI